MLHLHELRNLKIVNGEGIVQDAISDIFLFCAKHSVFGMLLFCNEMIIPFTMWKDYCIAANCTFTDNV